MYAIASGGLPQGIDKFHHNSRKVDGASCGKNPVNPAVRQYAKGHHSLQKPDGQQANLPTGHASLHCRMRFGTLMFHVKHFAFLRFQAR